MFCTYFDVEMVTSVESSVLLLSCQFYPVFFSLPVRPDSRSVAQENICGLLTPGFYRPVAVPVAQSKLQ